LQIGGLIGKGFLCMKKNLKDLHDAYPENCVYLSMLSLKEEWKGILPRL